MKCPHCAAEMRADKAIDNARFVEHADGKTVFNVTYILRENFCDACGLKISETGIAPDEKLCKYFGVEKRQIVG